MVFAYTLYSKHRAWIRTSNSSKESVGPHWEPILQTRKSIGLHIAWRVSLKGSVAGAHTALSDYEFVLSFFLCRVFERRWAGPGGIKSAIAADSSGPLPPRPLPHPYEFGTSEYINQKATHGQLCCARAVACTSPTVRSSPPLTLALRLVLLSQGSASAARRTRIKGPMVSIKGGWGMLVVGKRLSKRLTQRRLSTIGRLDCTIVWLKNCHVLHLARLLFAYGCTRLEPRILICSDLCFFTQGRLRLSHASTAKW